MTDKGLDGIANQEGAAKVFKEQDTMEIYMLQPEDCITPGQVISTQIVLL